MKYIIPLEGIYPVHTNPFTAPGRSFKLSFLLMSICASANVLGVREDEDHLPPLIVFIPGLLRLRAEFFPAAVRKHNFSAFGDCTKYDFYCLVILLVLAGPEAFKPMIESKMRQELARILA